MTIEKNYDIRFVAEMALREKQIQQNYRPIIAVHKWFARRPGTLFRSLLLSEFVERPVEASYYNSHSLPQRKIADPFMGGGTPLIEANRIGCDVQGCDVNPMAAWVVEEEIADLDLVAYTKAAKLLADSLTDKLAHLYKTRCPVTGRLDADVKYFLWVKVGNCAACSKDYDLSPGYVVAENIRHPRFVLACPGCGDLNEVVDPKDLGACACGTQLKTGGPVSRSKCACPHCGHVNSSPFRREGPPVHRLFAIEYHNPELKGRPGRLFKKPDADDLSRVTQAEQTWQKTEPRFVPDDEILEGDESSRLRRWGYRRFSELFNTRQLLALELSAQEIDRCPDGRIQRALATNFSDLLRYQNMLCRYDTMALKSLDIFSVHGFPVSYVQAESNILGIRNGGGLPVGSGGWVNIIDKYRKAKAYCTEPFEVQTRGKTKVTIPIPGEWIGANHSTDPSATSRSIEIRCESATDMKIADRSLDGVFTDPPYFGMVQYGELMQFCYVWLRKLMGHRVPGLNETTARQGKELTGNDTAARGIEHFTEGLAEVYRRMAKALKPGAPLAFTYHHNQQEAYCAVGVAILDAGLICSASLPCPAEMGGSIHIHGTGSSIVDTVFVCRESGRARREWLFEDTATLARIVTDEIAQLRAAGVKVTNGDTRCIALGHITRMAIWKLRACWASERPTAVKLAEVLAAMNALASLDVLKLKLEAPALHLCPEPGGLFLRSEQEALRDAVTF